MPGLDYHHYVPHVSTFVAHTLPQCPRLSVVMPLRNSRFQPDNIETLNPALNKESALPATTRNIVAREFDIATQRRADTFSHFQARLSTRNGSEWRIETPTYTPPVPLAPQIMIMAMSMPLHVIIHPLPNVKQPSFAYNNSSCVDVFKTLQPRVRFSILPPSCQLMIHETDYSQDSEDRFST